MQPVLTGLLIGIALVVLALGIFRAARAGLPGPQRLVLGPLRALALALLMLVVVGPTRERPRHETLPAQVAVLVDDSQSMGLPEAKSGQSRLSAGLAAAREFLAALPPTSPVSARWFALSDPQRSMSDPASLTARASETDLVSGLRGVLAAEHPQAILLVSDGADTRSARGDDLARLAQAQGATLWALSVGADAPLKDLAVDLVSAPRRVRAGSDFELRAGLRATGLEGASVRVRLERDGKPERSLNLSAPAAASTLKLKLRAGAPGRYRYSLRADPVPGELTPANNERSVLVEVVPDKPQVVLISGAPSPEYAALKRLLPSNPDLKLRAFVRKTRPAGFWRDDDRAEKSSLAVLGNLKDVSAVLLQDVPSEALAGLDTTLADFARGGGSLAFLAGSETARTPLPRSLTSVLPATLGGYLDEVISPRLRPGADPLAQALSSSNLPTLRGRVPLTPRPGASVILEAHGAPLLVSWQVGRGRALLLGTDGTHRWVFNPASGDAGERTFETFWSTLGDWLTEPRDDRPVVAHFERERYDAGTVPRLLVEVTDSALRPVSGATVTARVNSGSSTRSPLKLDCTPMPGTPGRYEVLVPVQAPGPLRAEVSATLSGKLLGADSAETQVIPATTEMALSRPDPRLLEEAAAETGGASGPAREATKLAQQVKLAPQSTERAISTSPTRGPWMLALLVALLSVTWWLQRRWRGM
ncbi:MAG: hypothetical protein ABFE16_04265 [Armatimonadia bacterium]